MDTMKWEEAVQKEKATRIGKKGEGQQENGQNASQLQYQCH